MHQTNAAEKAVQTWKSHFLAGLASLPDALISHSTYLDRVNKTQPYQRKQPYTDAITLKQHPWCHQ
eukprot:9441799-Ditylum_brightwellii.AAC.1